MIPSFFLFQSGLELGSVTVVFERRPRESPQPLEDGDQPRAIEAIRERQKQRDGAHETLQGMHHRFGTGIVVFVACEW